MEYKVIEEGGCTIRKPIKMGLCKGDKYVLKIDGKEGKFAVISIEDEHLLLKSEFGVEIVKHGTWEKISEVKTSLQMNSPMEGDHAGENIWDE